MATHSSTLAWRIPCREEPGRLQPMGSQRVGHDWATSLSLSLSLSLSDSILKSRHIALPTKVLLVKAMVFQVVMYGCESWTIKKAEHRRIDAFEMVFEKTLESPLDCNKIKPVNPKGNQSWIFTERTDAEAEAPILWSPDTKNWLTGKDPGAGKDWSQEEKGTTEDETVG